MKAISLDLTTLNPESDNMRKVGQISCCVNMQYALCNAGIWNVKVIPGVSRKAPEICHIVSPGRLQVIHFCPFCGERIDYDD